MCRHICDNLRRCFNIFKAFCIIWICTPCCHTCNHFIFFSFRTVYKTCFLRPECRSFNSITRTVTERSDIFIQKSDIFFCCQFFAALYCCLLCCPWFSVNNLLSFSVSQIQFFSDPIHQIYIQKSHQIKAESINVIFLCPVKHRFQNIFCAHLSFACHIISTSRAVGNCSIRKYTVKIPRRSSLKPGIQ